MPGRFSGALATPPATTYAPITPTAVKSTGIFSSITGAKALIADEKKLEKQIFGKGGLRSSVEGAAKIKTAGAELARIADGWRGLVYENKRAIEELQALEATLGEKDPQKAEVLGQLTALRAERVALLQQAVDAGSRLETLAWGLADDRRWTRASYATSSRKEVLETTRHLMWKLRDAIAVETSPPVAADHTELSLKSLQVAELEAQQTIAGAERHLEMQRLQLGAARKNDAFRLDVLGATDDTLGLLLYAGVVDAETTRAAELGDSAAQQVMDDARLQAMIDIGLDPYDSAYEQYPIAELIVSRAQMGDVLAKELLVDLQDRLGSAVDAAIDLLASAKATPKQLEAMKTLGAILKKYDFRADDLSSFDIAALKKQLDEQLLAAGLFGIVPKAEIEKMKAVEGRALDFTLLTDLSYGVIDVDLEKKIAADLKSKDHFSKLSTEAEVVDAFRPVKSGGSALETTLSNAAISGMYETIYGRTSKEVAQRYQTAITALEKHGVGADRKSFDAAMTKTIALLRTAKYESPLNAELALTQLCLLMGAEPETAKMFAARMNKGELVYTEKKWAAARGVAVSADLTTDVLEQLFASGTQAKSRYEARLKELTAPYAGSAKALDAGRSQVFELFREFPDLASSFYEEFRFSALDGFPPVSSGSAGSLAEATFLADAAAWKDWEDTKGYLWTGGYIAAGALLTVATLGTAGAGAALVVGTGYGVGISAFDVDKAAAEVTKARDALGVNAGSEASLIYRRNELIGAYGAMVINVVTAGIGAKLGAGVAAKELTKKLILREMIVGTALGAGAGAATVLLNPNALASPDLLGMVLKGTAVGSVGGAFGTGLGIGAGIAGKKISVALSKGTEGETKQQLAIEGEAEPRNLRDARALEDGSLLLTLEGGESVTVRIDAAEQIGLAPGAMLADSTPLALLGLAEPVPSSAELAPVPKTSKANAESSPLLESIVGRLSEPKAAVVSAAAEESPLIKRFVEKTGKTGANLVAELGADNFLAIYLADARPRALAKLGLGEPGLGGQAELWSPVSEVIAEQLVLAGAKPMNKASLAAFKTKLEAELRAELKASLPPGTADKTINALAASVTQRVVLALAAEHSSGANALGLWSEKPSAKAIAEVAAWMKAAGYSETSVTRETLWAVFDAPLLPQAKSLFDSIRSDNLSAIIARDALTLVHAKQGLFDQLKFANKESEITAPYSKNGTKRLVDEQRHMLLAATAELFYADAMPDQIKMAAADAVAQQMGVEPANAQSAVFQAYADKASAAWGEKQALAKQLGKEWGVSADDSVKVAKELGLLRALERRAAETAPFSKPKSYEDDLETLLAGGASFAMKKLQERRDHLLEVLPNDGPPPLPAVKDIQVTAVPKGVLKEKIGSTKGYESSAKVLAELELRLARGEGSAIGGSAYAEFRFPKSALDAAVKGEAKVIAYDGTMDQAIAYARSKLPKDAQGLSPGYKRLDLQGLDGSGPRSLVFFDDGSKYLLVSGIGKSRLLHNAGSLALYEGSGGQRIKGIEVAGQGTDYKTVLQNDITAALAKEKNMPTQLLIVQNPNDLKTAFGDKITFSKTKIKSVVPMEIATFNSPEGPKRLLIAKVAGNGVYGDTAGILVEAFFGANLKNTDPNVVFNGTAGGFAGVGKVGDIHPGGMLMPTKTIKEYGGDTYAMKTKWGDAIPADTLARLEELGVVLTDDHSAVQAPAIETHQFVDALVAMSESVDVEGAALISAIGKVNAAKKAKGLPEDATFTPIYTHSDDPRASRSTAFHDLAHMGPFFEGARFNEQLWKAMGFVLGMSP